MFSCRSATSNAQSLFIRRRWRRSGSPTASIFAGTDGPPGPPDLKGFGCKGRFILWLRLGVADSRAAHVGFVAKSRDEVDAAYAAAIAAGATDNGKPTRYYAANVFDPDGYSLEFVFKSWQHV